LNKALCHQKLNDYDEVKHNCNEALTLDGNNVKALFRRGQARFALGEIDNALADFERVKELEPENKAALNQITICKQKIKQYHEDEKKRYRNMFSKFAIADTSKIEEVPGADFDRIGQWKENERSHETTKFEAENPDLILCDNPITEELKNM
jgi:tetratricopeptide (TPR) repeat protein